MTDILNFLQTHKTYVDLAVALSAIVNLLCWFLGIVLLVRAWRLNAIQSISVGPMNIRWQEAEAVEATAAAARNWQSSVPDQKVDVPRIRATIAQAFEQQIADNLVGKAILWVDDNPGNNLLAVRALRRLQLDVVQATSTEAGLTALTERRFDLIISDMGRGDNMRAGYELLEAIRKHDRTLPFLIFAGSDSAEFRREAAERGAQLSTNDMIELIDRVIHHLKAD